jgi:hypothetical protein
MGNLQTWLMLLGVLLAGALVTCAGATLFLFVLLSRAAWRRNALRGGIAGGGLAFLALLLALLGLVYGGADGSVPYADAPQHWTMVGAVVFLMVVGFPSLALGFQVGAVFGYLFGGRRATANGSEDD